MMPTNAALKTTRIWRTDSQLPKAWPKWAVDHCTVGAMEGDSGSMGRRFETFGMKQDIGTTKLVVELAHVFQHGGCPGVWKEPSFTGLCGFDQDHHTHRFSPVVKETISMPNFWGIQEIEVVIPQAPMM